jgi:hypothetical protein
MVLRIPGTNLPLSKRTGVLATQAKEAKRLYEASGKNKENARNLKRDIEKSKRKMHITGRGRTKYHTKDFVKAEATAIDSMIKAHYLKRLSAPLDWIMDSYEEGQAADSTNAKAITKWITAWGEYQLYKIPPASRLPKSVLDDIVDFANRMNSLNKIAFSPSTNFNNLVIGQAMDLIKEPGAYWKGWGRVTKGGDVIKNIKKANNILKRNGLANIVHDSIFERLNKEVRIPLPFYPKGIDLSKIEDKGYMPMEVVEKGNQLPVFIGLMTDEEWNAYNDDGEIINPSANKHLSSYRAISIERRVKEIHGEYGTLNAAPLWLTTQGKAFFAFKKWMPSMIYSHFARYRIDSNFNVKSGIIPTIKLLGKLFVYKNLKSKEKQEARYNELKKMVEDGDIENATFFDNADEYFRTLILESNNGNVSYKQLSPSDMANLRSFIVEAAFMAMSSIISQVLFFSDDPEKHQSQTRRSFARLFSRFSGDVLFMYNFDNIEYLFGSMVPAAELLTSVMRFNLNFAKWAGSLVKPELRGEAKYERDSIYAAAGTPKFLIDATYFIPYGSAIRQLQKVKRSQTMKHNYYNLHELGLTDSDLNEMGLSDHMISEFDLMEYAKFYEKTFSDLKQSQEYLNLQKQGIDPMLYYDLQSGIKIQKEEADMITKALKGYYFKKANEIGDMDLDQLYKDAKEARKTEKKTKGRTRKAKERKFETAKEKLENK